MRHFLSVILILALAGICASSALATNFNVPASYATIQAAVDAAGASGDEVHVTTAGAYPGTVTITDKNLSIIGDVSGVQVTGAVTCAGTAAVTLNNLTISVAGADGITDTSTGDLNVINCTITQNGIRGILHSSAGNVTITGSTLSSNSFDGYCRNAGSGGTLTVNGNSVLTANGRAGIMLEGGTNVVINVSATEIKNNNVGIYLTNAPRTPTVQLSDVTLLNNPQDQILLNAKTSLTMTNVTVSHTSTPSFMAGVRLDSSAPASGTSTVQMTGCTFTCPFGYNCFWLGHQSNVTLNGCSFNGYASAITVTDNTSALATLTMNDTTFSGSASVPVSINGSDGNPAHVVTANRCKFTGAAGVKFNLLNVVGAQATLTNCIFDGGDTQVWSQGDQAWLKVRHCTLEGDTVTTNGLFFAHNSAENLVVNSIIDKTYRGMDCAASVAVANHHNLIRATHSNFATVTPGTNNILDADPLFTTVSSGPGTANFQLKTNSPAINVGDATLGIAQDYAKNARPAPVGTAPDLGAYEEQTAVPVELSTFDVQ